MSRVDSLKENHKDRTEESCIDVLMFSSDLQESFKTMMIDDQRKLVQSKIIQNKKGILVKESNHHALLAKFSNIAKSKTKTRNELYNLNNIECQKKFKIYTTNTKMLSSIFESNDDINILTQRFLKKQMGA